MSPPKAVRVSELNLLECVAMHLLFQGELPWAWTGATARRATQLALNSLNVQIPASDLRTLVNAAYQLGRQLEPLPPANAAVPWDIGPLYAQLCTSLFQGCVDPPKEAFLNDVLNRVRSSWDINSWKIPDWVQELNKLDGKDPWGALGLDLKNKLEAAWKIENALDQRQKTLIDWAEAQLDVRLSDLVDAMKTIIANAPQRVEDITKEPGDYRDNPGRISKDEIDFLSGLAHQAVRQEFSEWLKRCNPLLQRLVHRRISVLESDPLLATPWVKRILGAHRFFELRLVCGGSHYRILFRQTQQRPLKILAFGLRRDLRRLIEKAKRI